MSRPSRAADASASGFGPGWPRIQAAVLSWPPPVVIRSPNDAGSVSAILVEQFIGTRCRLDSFQAHGIRVERCARVNSSVESGASRSSAAKICVEQPRARSSRAVAEADEAEERGDTSFRLTYTNPTGAPQTADANTTTRAVTEPSRVQLRQAGQPDSRAKRFPPDRIRVATPPVHRRHDASACPWTAGVGEQSFEDVVGLPDQRRRWSALAPRQPQVGKLRQQLREVSGARPCCGMPGCPRATGVRLGLRRTARSPEEPRPLYESAMPGPDPVAAGCSSQARGARHRLQRSQTSGRLRPLARTRRRVSSA